MKSTPQDPRPAQEVMHVQKMVASGVAGAWPEGYGAGVKHLLLMIAMVALVGGCGKKPAWTSDPSNPQNVIIEKAIRDELEKPTGALTKADLEKVTRLGLGLTEITDEGLKEVAKLQQLTSLNLGFTQITDAGLKEVAKLKQLNTFYLNDTKVTESGVAELKKALPKCQILRGSP